MKANIHTKHPSRPGAFFTALVLVWFLSGCTAIAPKPEMLQLPSHTPTARRTSFNQALAQLGIQSEIYGGNLMKIQCRNLEDVTGTSYHTGGEIPKSITIMVKSALNAIGGKVLYIPFWPDYFAGLQVAGYPASNQKLVPDVILAGGITEFDRGLTSVDRKRNMDAETEDIRDPSSLLSGRTIGLDYSQGDKLNMAKIAVDFNLISYQALCGIPKMQSSNGITVFKGIKEQELGFTLFGPTIGLRGSVKKIQGRHDAVRLLVQFSVIQLVGRFLDLPYWQLLEGAQPDPVVIESIKTNFQRKDSAERTLMLKRLLWLHGHPVPVTKQWDAQSQAALVKALAKGKDHRTSASVDTYLELYLSVPVTRQSVKQASQYDRILAQIRSLEKRKALDEKSRKARPPKTKDQTEPKQKGLPLKDNTGKKAPKTEKTPQKPLKQEVIIITPLESRTQTLLKSIVRKIGDKRKHRTDDENALFPNSTHQDQLVPPARRADED